MGLCPWAVKALAREGAWGQGVVYVFFSNSLIIHQVKTKKIQTVKEVWIPSVDFDDLTALFTP